MKKLFSIFGPALVVLFLSLNPLHPLLVSAQSSDVPGTGQALEIAPPVIVLTTDPGKNLTAQISLRNVSGGDLKVKGQVNDFLASGEDGTPKVILEEDEGEPNPYSIKDWVAPLPELLLVPRQVVTLNVTFRVPADASPGGHYGVIRFTGVAPELEDTGVSLSASLGSLVLLKVNGATEEKLDLEEFSVNKNGKTGKFFESTPLQFVTRLKNSGNTHAQPSGQITITDMFGKKVATLNINLPPRNILPASIRRFDLPLDSATIGNKKLFGRYTASMKLKYSDDKELTANLTFWVIPYRLIATVICFIIIGFIVLRIAIKRYNKRIIKKSRSRW